MKLKKICAALLSGILALSAILAPIAKGSDLSDWKTVSQQITLKAGDNSVELKATAALPSSLYIDNFMVDGDFDNATSSEPQTVSINGTLIKNLTVKDTENAGDWSIINGLNVGDVIYGDRDITAVRIPENLTNAEVIRTACDSKLYTGELAAFTAGADISVYVAVDSRINSGLDWLKAWSMTSDSVTTSNGLTLIVYRMSVKSGASITLGTNGGSNGSANYIVFALSKEDDIIKGDVSFSGEITAIDLALAKRGMFKSFSGKSAEKAADADSDGKVSENDAKLINAFIHGKITEFPEQATPPATLSPEAYMAQVSSTIVNSEPSGATAENAGTAYGTYEKKTIYSDVCKRNKSFNVLLPAGYSTAKKYPVMYVLHGYWGNEDALLDKGDASLRLRQIIGNAIASGEAEDMIVVFPDIYASATQDACSGLDAKNNAAYDNFINLLVKEIMPYMEKNYSIKTGRDNTAITGFSMGGRESLIIGFLRPDLFGYVGAMCPAPGVSDCVSADKMKFTSTGPYLLLVSAGSNDTLIYSTPAGYHDTMTSNKTTHIWHYVNGGDHGGKTIRPHMYNFVRAVFKA